MQGGERTGFIWTCGSLHGLARVCFRDSRRLDNNLENVVNFLRLMQASQKSVRYFQTIHSLFEIGRHNISVIGQVDQIASI